MAHAHAFNHVTLSAFILTTLHYQYCCVAFNPFVYFSFIVMFRLNASPSLLQYKNGFLEL